MKFRLLASTLIGLVLTACNLTLAEDLTPPPGYIPPTPLPTLGPLYPASAPDISNGAAIYAEKCASCHGAAGMGDGPQGLELPNSVTALGLAEIGRAAVPAEWYVVVSQGRVEKLMPSYASLSDQERWDVVAYSLTLSMPPEQARQGRELFMASCPSCPTDLFTDQQRMAALSQASLLQLIEAGGEGLPAFGAGLTEAGRRAVAAYLRSLSFAANPVPAGTPPAPVPVTAPAEQPGVISGQASNGSGGDLPPGLTVTLHGFDQDASGNFTEPVTLDTPLQADGTFVFRDVPVPAGRVFVAALAYSGVEYVSSPIYADGKRAAYDLPITCYESTTDVSGLSVDRWHIFFNFEQPGVVQVIELLVISNPGNQTIVSASDTEPALAFSLPESASNLQFQNGESGDGRYVRTAAGFGDLAPIEPGIGEFQAVFAYDLPYEGALEFSRLLDLPVASAILMVPEGVRVKSDLLQKGEMRQFQGTDVMVYNSQALPVGATLQAKISGGPAGFNLSNPDGQQRILVTVAAIGVLLVLAGVYLFWRDRSRSAGTVGAEDDLPDADSLLDAIIALDDLHKSGSLPDDVYQARRSQLKERLRTLMQ